jgi:hypothetical protein
MVDKALALYLLKVLEEGLGLLDEEMKETFRP